MLFRFFNQLLVKELCPHCGRKLKELGYVQGYIDSTYCMCQNKSCESYHRILHYKRGKIQAPLAMQYVKRTGSMVTYKNLHTDEIGQQEYL